MQATIPGIAPHRSPAEFHREQSRLRKQVRLGRACVACDVACPRLDFVAGSALEWGFSRALNTQMRASANGPTLLLDTMSSRRWESPLHDRVRECCTTNRTGVQAWMSRKPRVWALEDGSGILRVCGSIARIAESQPENEGLPERRSAFWTSDPWRSEVRQSIRRGMPRQERWYGCDRDVTDKDRMHTVLLVRWRQCR